MATKKYSDYLKGFSESDDTQTYKTKLTNAEKNVSNWDWSKDTKDVRNQILNRPKFNYDYTNDPLYNQYKDSYTRQGKLAMTDTMAQASQLTGGYGNSYATSVGQQTYNQYMQQLNDIIPQLYSQARDVYNDETNSLYNKYGLLSGEDQALYDRLVSDRGYYSGAYGDARANDLNAYSQGVSNAMNTNDFDYLDRLGMDTSRLREQYNLNTQLQQKSLYSGSGTGGTTAKTPTEEMFDKAMSEYRNGGEEALYRYMSKLEGMGYDVSAIEGYANTGDYVDPNAGNTKKAVAWYNSHKLAGINQATDIRLMQQEIQNDKTLSKEEKQYLYDRYGIGKVI